MFLNGNRVGDLDLTPGFTGYDHTLHVQAYDVADLVIAGNNVWQVVLSDGWFRGRHGNSQGSDNYGTTLAFLGSSRSATSPSPPGPGGRPPPVPSAAPISWPARSRTAGSRWRTGTR